MPNTFAQSTFPTNRRVGPPAPTPVVVPGTFFPFLKPFRLPLARAWADMQNGNNVEGYLGDGDFIRLPNSGAGTLEYFDNTGASVFTSIPVNINASIDEWVGFTLDDATNLLYVVGVDEGTTNNTYYLASINSSGTIVNIGNGQPVTDLGDVSASWWGDAITTTGATIIRRNASGTGNIFIEQTNTTSANPRRTMEINIATGLIVGSGAQENAIGVAGLRSANGNYINLESYNTSLGSVYPEITAYSEDGGRTPILTLDVDCGLPQFQLQRFIQWKEYITSASSVAGLNTEGPRHWLPEDFFTFTDACTALHNESA